MTIHGDYLHQHLHSAGLRERQQRNELLRLAAQDAPARPTARERLAAALRRLAPAAPPRPRPYRPGVAR